MSFKDFFDEKSSTSSMRLNVFIVVITCCLGLAYLTVTSGISIASYLVTALITAITGKGIQKYIEAKNVQIGDSSANEESKSSE